MPAGESTRDSSASRPTEIPRQAASLASPLRPASRCRGPAKPRSAAKYRRNRDRSRTSPSPCSPVPARRPHSHGSDAQSSAPARLAPAAGGFSTAARGSANLRPASARRLAEPRAAVRSEEHTSELQSRFDLVCRLLLEKKKKETKIIIYYLTHQFIYLKIHAHRLSLIALSNYYKWAYHTSDLKKQSHLHVTMLIMSQDS